MKHLTEMVRQHKAGKTNAAAKAKLDDLIQQTPRWPTGSLTIVQQRLNKEMQKGKRVVVS